MIANYHTHTWRCHHASGSEREYVERAIEGGFRILGFADHSPYLFPDGYVSGHRMLPSQFEDYVTVLSDLVNLLEDPDFFRQEATRLCRAVKEMDLPLEINLLGLEEGRHYPCEPFWEVVHETGNKVIIGCDAHSPRAVYQPDVIQKAYDLAARYQLNLLDTVELVNPFADRKDPMEPLKL